jgi:hypothetical protein
MPMTTHCPFNNVPCMRRCVTFSTLQCQLQIAHDAVNDPDEWITFNALAHVWQPPWKAPPPPYDGSLDDWDVDHFTPPPPPAPKPRDRIEAILARFGITIDVWAEFTAAEMDFTFEGETIHVDDWCNPC